ncbi:MAG: hypothetical protein ACO328_06495 [Burkholderiaceae bacterium]
MTSHESTSTETAFCQHPLDPETSSALGLSFVAAVRDAQGLEGLMVQRAAIHKAMRVNQLRYSEGVLLQNFLTEKAEAWARTLNVEPSEKLPANKLNALLRRREPCLVVVDGHNLLFRLSILFLQWFEEGRPSLEAREQLTHRLLDQVVRYESLHIDLWFDGDEASCCDRHTRLKVCYSGGKGKDRADRKIIAMLREASPTPRPLTFVVTDDLGLARRIRKTNVIPIACGEFRHFVQASPVHDATL